ncbi:hypothetical protein LCGC14_1072210 [marine sediment metagenome]|uniref:Uncharacterized protein n=1 Tax=marine sediment metagenome TaxID=412755 RepID=A0A0F9N557_9ZZZZ
MYTSYIIDFFIKSFLNIRTKTKMQSYLNSLYDLCFDFTNCTKVELDEHSRKVIEENFSPLRVLVSEDIMILNKKNH